MTKRERYRYVLDYFRARTPEVTTELEFGSVFQLLVAVILSAQCTDKRVNQITPALFERLSRRRKHGGGRCRRDFRIYKERFLPQRKG